MLGAVEILVILVLALALAGATGVLALRALGLDPVWLARARHSLGEAGYRARGVLAEFGDWLRLGR
jgi:hypothetical protein